MTALAPARSLTVESRMPSAPKERKGDPFNASGDIVLDCSVPGCGWHAYTERIYAKQAWQEHYRQWHASQQQVGVVLLNHPDPQAVRRENGR